ncbi:MAG: hypothetical protein DLM70_05085, partial [Chloroflexi bacterium]
MRTIRDGLVVGLVVFAAVLVFGQHRPRATPSRAHAAAIRHAMVHPAINVAPLPLTIASIFAARAPGLRGYDRRKIRTVIATGDVIPARSVNYKMVTYGDFLYPFRRTAGFLRRADLTVVNLESPLVAGCPTTDSGMSFCGDPRAVQGLTFAGVDVA